MASDSAQASRLPLLEKTNNQRCGHSDVVPEAPPAHSPTPMDVPPSDAADEVKDAEPAPPDYQRPSPCQPAQLAPRTWNNSTIHDPVTRQPLDPFQPIPQYSHEDSATFQL